MNRNFIFDNGFPNGMFLSLINTGTKPATYPQVSSKSNSRKKKERLMTSLWDDGPIDPPQDENVTLENVERFLTNLVKNPRLALADGVLYTADRLGLPSNAMNFLRDAALGSNYRFHTAVTSLYQTIVDGKCDDAETFKQCFQCNYDYYTKNPSTYQQFRSIKPLINTNGNYSDDEMAALHRMVDKNGNITTKSIEALGEGYGRQDGLLNYFTPVRVVSSSIGRATGQNGYIHDIFDWNISDPQGKAVHNAYEKRMKENGPSFDYNTMRYIGQNVGMTSDMPDDYKIKTTIKVEKHPYNFFTHSGDITTMDELNDHLNYRSNQQPKKY